MPYRVSTSSTVTPRTTCVRKFLSVKYVRRPASRSALISAWRSFLVVASVEDWSEK
jgi:hypothetical protein